MTESNAPQAETNPVLATALAAVALLGVLGGLLPPGLVERMTQPDTGPRGERDREEIAQPAQNGPDRRHTEQRLEGGPDDAPAVSPSTAPAATHTQAGQAQTADGSATAGEIPAGTAQTSPVTGATAGQSEQQSSPPVPGPTLQPSPPARQPAHSVTQPDPDRQVQPVPSSRPEPLRPRRSPGPYYPQTPAWGGYPTPAYPPAYDPYYGQPYYPHR